MLHARYICDHRDCGRPSYQRVAGPLVVSLSCLGEHLTAGMPFYNSLPLWSRTECWKTGGITHLYSKYA